jgi:EmrB/QacA subfamily drug resistance transporter
MEHEMTKTRRYLILFNVCIATFMATLDSSIVNISLPTISNFFSVSINTVQWTVTAYLLAISSLLLVWGKISDLYSRKYLFAGGLAVFTLGSLLCGMAASFPMLVAARVLQAIGASISMALVNGIVTSIFPATERGKALGIVGTVVAVGSLAGPSLGGLLVHVASWRAIFYVNLPFGILGVVLTFILLPESVRRTEAGAFDVKGSLLFVSSIALLFLGLLSFQDGLLSVPWAAVTVLLAIGIFTLFLRLEARHPNPLLDLKLFRNSMFSSSLATAYLSFVAMFSYLFFMPFYLQDVLKLPVLTAGLVMSVYPLTTGIVSPISGSISDRYKKVPLTLIGLSITTLALAWVAFLDASAPIALIMIPVFLMGLGGSCFQSPNNSQIMGSVSRDRLGVAGSITAFFRNFGMISGTTASVMLYVFVTKTGIDNLSSGTFDAPLFLKGFRAVLLFASALTLVAVVVVVVQRYLQRKKVALAENT